MHRFIDSMCGYIFTNCSLYNGSEHMDIKSKIGGKEKWILK